MEQKDQVIKIIAMQVEQASLKGDTFTQKILEQFAYLVELESVAAARSLYDSVRSNLNLWQQSEFKLYFEQKGYFVK